MIKSELYGGSSSVEYFLEYFTPATEVDFCGHATVALFHTLASTGMLKIDGGQFEGIANTRAGRFKVVVTKGDESFKVKLTHDQKPQFKKLEERSREIAEALKIGLESLSARFPLRLAKTANWHLVVGLKSKDVLDGINYDAQKLSQLLSEFGAITAHVFCEQADDSGKYFVRNFGPSVGIPEDPATGSAAGAFGAYLFCEGLLRKDQNHLMLVQGEAMKRPSSIELEIIREGDKLMAVEVVGTAVQSFTLVSAS